MNTIIILSYNFRKNCSNSGSRRSSETSSGNQPAGRQSKSGCWSFLTGLGAPCSPSGEENRFISHKNKSRSGRENK